MGLTRAQKARRKQREQLAAVILTIGCTAAPWGFSVPIVWSCVLWGIGWLSFVFLIASLAERAGSGPRLSFIAVLTVLMLTIVWHPIKSSYKREMASALSGDLKADSDGKDHSGEQPILQIGESRSRLRWNGPQTSLQGLQFATDKITLRRDGNELKFSTTVRDRFDNLIVEVSDNHWTVSSSRNNCWDKNYTEDSLEVKDGRGRVVLQVRMLPDRIQLQEEFPKKDGSPKDSAIFEEDEYTEQDGIKPRFKYPSELYWGELDKKSGYAATDAVSSLYSTFSDSSILSTASRNR